METGEKLAARRAVLVEAEGGSGRRLGGVEESTELDQVDAVLSVVVVMVAGRPADAAVRGGTFTYGATGWRIAGVAAESFADEAFEAAFGEVGAHGWSVAERNRFDSGARRRHPKRKRPSRLGRKFLHPGPVTDELLDELTSTEVLPAHEERPYPVFPDRCRLRRPVSDSVVASHEAPTFRSDASQKFGVVYVRWKELRDVYNVFTESLHSCRQLRAEVVIDEEPHAAS